MKRLCSVPLFCFSLILTCSLQAQNNFTLNPLTTFGGNGDGSIRPGDQPWVSGPTTPPQLGDLPISTNGLNQRGLSYDPVSGALVYVDTHSGSAGTNGLAPNSAVYILDSTNGTLITTLNITGITNGSYTHVAAAVADDGAIYVCNQVNVSTNPTTPFKIYRWGGVNDVNPPVVAFSNNIAPTQRYGESIDIRGSGTGTQIIIGSMPGTTATNVVIFTTSDGTNFSANVIACTNVVSANFNDGIAFGTNNTFWAKRIGAPLLYMTYDLAAKTARTLAVYNASNMPGYFNLAAISVDNVNKLMAAIEEVGGTTTSAADRIWLFDITDPMKAPVALGFRNFTPNNPNATAPLGYLDFGNGRLFANNVNNGLLASTVDSIPTPPPIIIKDLIATNRVAVGQTAHFEVQAYPSITGYQWRTNTGVGPTNDIPGATNYFVDVPNVTTNDSGRIYRVVITNPAGSVTSSDSLLSVVNPADLFHLSLLWSFAAGQTNYITNPTGAGTPDERSIAFNARSNQLLVVKRSGGAAQNVAMFVVNPDTGEYLYSMKTNGIILSPINIALLYITVADDGAVYACNGNLNAGTAVNFRIYRWADSGPNTYPTNIWTGNPAPQVTSSTDFRWGDAMGVRGSGAGTQLIVDNQDVGGGFRFVGVLTPSGPDLNQTWNTKGFVLQNNQGGTGIGRTLQFSATGDFFWQKRFLAGGAPLVQSSFALTDPDPALAPVVLSSTGLPLYTNGTVAINFALNLAAAVNFTAGLAASGSSPDTLDLFDVSAPLSPVVLNRYNFPVNHTPNQNAIAQVVFGTNVVTGTNYVFALDANNGIMGLTLSSGPLPPPTILTQPKNQRVVAGASFTLGVVVDSIVAFQWQKTNNTSGFTNILNATNSSYVVASGQVSDSGSYRVFCVNAGGSVTSSVANVTVSLPQDNYSLSQIWATNGGYVSTDGGSNTPKERSIAYNALSNQLLVVRCPVAGNPNASTPEVHVLDANTGIEQYTLNVSTIFGGTESEVSGSNPLNLCAIAASDDGSIYACNEVPNGGGGAVGFSTTKLLRVYRWTNSAPTTIPVQIFSGDPANQPVNLRWGDTFGVRGSGTNTELVFDDQQQGLFAGILKPLDDTLNTFTNIQLNITTGSGSIGRSIQFQTGTNFWQKRKGLALNLTRYDTNTLSGVQAATYNNFSSTLGGVTIDPVRNLAIGVDYVGNTTSTPDQVALYEISDLETPMLISRYNFPVTPNVANANFISSTVVGGNKVFSLNGNNGIVAFNINGPKLSITSAGTDVLISWPLFSGYTLQSTPSITPPSTWTSVGTGTIVSGRYVVTNSVSGTSLFYRLIH